MRELSHVFTSMFTVKRSKFRKVEGESGRREPRRRDVTFPLLSNEGSKVNRWPSFRTSAWHALAKRAARFPRGQRRTHRNYTSVSDVRF